MERDTPPYSGGGAGAGGKFRKPPFQRRPPSTPYDRPINKNQSDDSQDGGGWLSKLVVNPARRFIVGGATRILPSFFSKSESTSDEEDDDIPHLSSGDHDDQDIDATANVDGSKHVSELEASRLTGDAGPSNGAERLKGNSEHDNARQDKSTEFSGDPDLAKIENLVKGKKFSRDEISRLTEILNSRVVDVSDGEQEKAKQNVLSPGQSKGGLLDHEIPSTSVMGKQHIMESPLLETPTPRFYSNVQDEVAASPIDLARAYMGSRTSELGRGSYSILSKDGRDQQQHDLFASKPHIPTPSLKSSACWPGAMVQDQHGFLTPQNQRGRYGLHNVRRTPYSRTIYSMSKPQLTQLQADSKSSNITLTHFQSRTPNYSQMKSSTDVVDGGFGSVGPIRRVRNKFATEYLSKAPSTPYSAQIASSQADNPSPSRSFVPVFQKNLETGGTSGASIVHTIDRSEQVSKGMGIPTGPSNETVRKILEHLDRHKPTPKEKAAELKAATEWKRSPSQDAAGMPKERTSLASLTGSDFQKNGLSNDFRSSVEGTVGGGNNKGMLLSTNASTATTNTTNSVPDDSRFRSDVGTGPLFGLRNTTDSEIRNPDKKAIASSSKEKETSQPWPLDNRTNGQDLTRKRASQPSLKPISFTRPDPQQVISSDNGRGFTFPFSAISSSASEAPTPSIMPSFPATSVTQSTELPAVPTFSFGTKKSTQRIVFSFASTSSFSVDDGPSDLKFNFGSDKKRVSFGSIGKDAIVIN